MALKGFTRNFKPLEMLSEEKVEAIHRGVLEVLWITGVRVEQGRALKLLGKNGCKVDYDEKRVRIPPALVEECLRKCPSSFTVKARDSQNNLQIGGNTLYFVQAPGMSSVDLDTWEPKQVTVKEHGDSCRVLDALDSVHMLCAYEFYMDMLGIPLCMMTLEGLASGLRNSSKVQVGGTTHGSETFAIEMAKAVGSELLQELPSSPPLTLYSDVCDQTFAFAEAGFPLQPLGGAMFGGTGPATIAGSTITNNAELIAMIVLAQIIKPGIGIHPMDFCFPMNMKSGSPGFGAVGAALHYMVFHQYWRWLGIPASDCAGLNVNAKSIDFQSGYEKSLSCLASALAGSNRIYFHGMVSQELTYSDVQAVLDDDIAGWIGRFLENIEVSEDTLAVDLINQVGPIPGAYLNTKHTREWYRKEQFIPKVADRLTYPEWQKTGKQDAFGYAKQRLGEILATHKPLPLTTSQEVEIERILKEAREYFRKKGQISDEEWTTYNSFY